MILKFDKPSFYGFQDIVVHTDENVYMNSAIDSDQEYILCGDADGYFCMQEAFSATPML